MVCRGVSWYSASPIHFREKGVKTSAVVYQESILKPIMKPLNDTLFTKVDWTFQQDSAGAHAAKSTQKWLEKNIPNFICKKDWTLGSPDLNPLDYEIWEKLEEMACKKPHRHLESLERSLEQALANFPIETLRKEIEWLPEHL